MAFASWPLPGMQNPQQTMHRHVTTAGWLFLVSLLLVDAAVVYDSIDDGARCTFSKICDGDVSCEPDGLGCLTHALIRRQHVTTAMNTSFHAYRLDAWRNAISFWNQVICWPLHVNATIPKYLPQASALCQLLFILTCQLSDCLTMK